MKKTYSKIIVLYSYFLIELQYTTLTTLQFSYFFAAFSSCSKAFFKSLHRSSTFSKPTETLIILSVMPSLIFSSGGTHAWVITDLVTITKYKMKLGFRSEKYLYSSNTKNTYGISIKLSYPPRLSANVNNFKFDSKVVLSLRPPLT